MRAFINELSKLLKIERRDLIEKDLIIRKLLYSLSQNDFFYNNFLFKGGSCLITCYLGYYRFSEDIDFTWKNQQVFNGMSQNKINRFLSPIIDKIGKIVEVICENNNIDFRCDKSDENYTIFGGGKKMVTFKLYYTSEILKNEMLVEIQINFVECLEYESELRNLNSLIFNNREIEMLFPKEYEIYSTEIVIPAYNSKEILCEKVRAILTRQGSSVRDFLDIYFILDKYKFKIEDFKNQIIKKTLFALILYKKYKENLEMRKELLISGDLFTLGEERDLLLIKIKKKDFYNFINKFSIFLKNLTEEIYEKINHK